MDRDGPRRDRGPHHSFDRFEHACLERSFTTRSNESAPLDHSFERSLKREAPLAQTISGGIRDPHHSYVGTREPKSLKARAIRIARRGQNPTPTHRSDAEIRRRRHTHAHRSGADSFRRPHLLENMNRFQTPFFTSHTHPRESANFLMVLLLLLCSQALSLHGVC
jgi:hypothetical protein